MVRILFYKVLMLSLSGTIFYSLLTFIKPITKKFFSPSWNYYLILITIITFLIPYGIVMPKSQRNLINVQNFIAEKNLIRNNKNQSIVENTVIDNKGKSSTILPIYTVNKETGEKQTSLTKTKETLGVPFVLDNAWIIWILGSLLCISVKLTRIIQFKKKLKTNSGAAEKQEVKDIFYYCCEQLGIHRNILLKVCSEIGTPMATGLITPIITIPSEEFDSNTLKMIFTHELMHYKRKDLWIKTVSFGVSVVHWFNPLIYIVNDELNKQCELSCDWQITNRMSSVEKQYYGIAILNVINDSINRKIGLGVGMVASSKNQLKERLFMIKSDKRPKKLINLLAFIIAVGLIILGGFATNVLGSAKENKSTNDFAVVVKKNELWAVNLSKTGNEIIIDKGGIFSCPSISPDGLNVAYTKDQGLYVSTIDLSQGKNEVMKVSEKVLSYAWANSSDLSYSTEKGGLNGFNLTSKKASTYIESEERYENIVGDGKGTIYGEVYRYYLKDGQQYVEGKGLANYEVASGKTKVVIHSKPYSEDMGLEPRVAGISKDGAYVYIWCRVQSGSTNADGVPFGIYEVKNDKFTPFNKEQVFALANVDNLAINPVDGRFPVINNGGSRLSNINKTLGKVDVTKGTLTNILPKNMISTDGIYGSIDVAKGMVTMTPSFSPDGKKVIFSASNANVDWKPWLKQPHNIYTVDLETKKVEKITKDNTFDSDPTYISKGTGIVFARSTEVDDISLMRLQGNKEECISKGIKLDDNSKYYGNYKLWGVLDIYISE